MNNETISGEFGRIPHNPAPAIQIDGEPGNYRVQRHAVDADGDIILSQYEVLGVFATVEAASAFADTVK